MTTVEETLRRLMEKNQQARDLAERRASRLADAITGEGDYTEITGEILDEIVNNLRKDSERDTSSLQDEGQT